MENFNSLDIMCRNCRKVTGNAKIAVIVEGLPELLKLPKMFGFWIILLRECSFIIGGGDGSKMGGLRKIDEAQGGSMKII